MFLATGIFHFEQIDNMALSWADTCALVTAMRHRLEMEQLLDGVTMDLEALAAYDGWGCCPWLAVYQDTRTRERIRSWDTDRRWTVTQEDERELVMGDNKTASVQASQGTFTEM